MKKPRLLVVDDDENIRTQMKWALLEDYDVFLATDGEEALNVMVKKKPSLVTLDLGLPPSPEDITEGLKLLGQFLQLDPTLKVVVVTGSPERSAALKAISLGAHDFFTKPIDIDELKAILKRAYYVHSLEIEYRDLQKKVREKSFNEIIGSCPKMLDVFNDIRKIATTDVSALITGASGTGKELVARALHRQSERRDKPFVAINCGAIPENLMESELFGHEKGSFTGAHTTRKGKFEVANKGVIFLDEIGELPLALQVKILRFLQDHKIERVGGRKMIDVDVRVIAATNKNLKKLVSKELFRDDLYYRLAVVNINLPPLVERGDDISILAKSFLNQYSISNDAPKQFSEEAMENIIMYQWPGNVRELENRVRRAITLADGPSITSKDLGLVSAETPGMGLNLKAARVALDKKYIKLAVLKHDGNISKAADELGLSRPTLHQLMKRHSISPQKGKNE